MATDYAVAANSVCQVTMKGTLFNQAVMNTFYYRLDPSGGTITNGGAFLADFNDTLSVPDNFYDAYMACLPALVENVFADLQWIDPDRFIKREFVVGPVGTFTHVPTTANLAAVLELRANIADRRSIGSKHLPGLGGAALVAGNVSAGLISQIDNFGGICTTEQPVGARSMRPIVFGRARPSYTDKHGKVHPAIPKSYREVSGYIVQRTARVMRRRTVGLGI